MEAWGKFHESSGRFHRLEHHCADVAACFEALLRDQVLRGRFVRAAGANEFTDTTAARLTFLAYLHDVGKLNTGFQFKVRPRNELPPRAPRPAGHIAEALLCFDQSDICALLGLHDIVDEWGDGVVGLAYAMLAHHGRPARRPTRSGSGPPELWMPFAGYDPRETAKLLGERGRSWFSTAFSGGPAMPDTPALAHLFAGTLTLADQLGSDEEAFRYEPDPDPDYIERARRIAADVVYAGWLAERFGNAVAVEECRLVSVSRSRAVRGDGGGPEGPDAIVHGTFAVADEETFGGLLRNGVGRHRAYGYGMLLLRPPNRAVPER